MKKSNLVIFGLFAVLFVLVVPFWAIGGVGGEDGPPTEVSANEQTGQALFVTNCGACHTLASAGTLGVVGPDLDELLGAAPPDANRDRVLNAIDAGVEGRMPADIVTGTQAEEVADFVARTAGR